MRYSIKPRERSYVKDYGFLYFAKNIGKNLSNKYGQKLVDSAKKSATYALKIASKRTIQKTADASGDPDKITSIKKNHQVNHTQMRLAMNTKRKIYISTRKTKKFIDELRLI